MIDKERCSRPAIEESLTGHFADVEYYGAMHNEEDSSRHTIRNILTHDFVFGFLGLFAFIVAYHALIPTLPIFFARLGSDEREIGMLVGIFGGSSLVFRLIVGSILLKYSEKSVMMFGALLFAVTFLASIVLRPFWPFFAIRFFQGVAFAFIDTAALAFIIKVTPLANRGRAISYFVLAPPFSQAIAPSLGMFLINQYNFTVLFLFCVGLSLCAFFFSWKVKGQNVNAPDNEIPANNNLFLERKIVAPSIMNFLQNFVWGGIIAFLPLYAINCGVTNPGLVLYRQCHHAYNGQGSGREDPGHIQQGKDYSDFHFYINDYHGHPCLFNDSSHVYSRGFALGNRRRVFSFPHQWLMPLITPVPRPVLRLGLSGRSRTLD